METLPQTDSQYMTVPVETTLARAPILGVSLICRNEEKFVEDCIRSIFSQSISPELLVVIDDGSTDNTPMIVEKLAKEFPIHYEMINAPRIFKGCNIAVAIDASLRRMMKLREVDWIVRMDCDARLPNPLTFELMIENMRKTPKLGVTGAFFGKKMVRHVCDAVRLYRRECLEEIMNTNIINPGRYPLMYGHDSFAIFRANWLGWDCKPTDVEYIDLRPYKRNLWQWYQTGWFRYHNGFGLVHSVGTAFRYIRASPIILGSLVCFLSWAVCHLRRGKIVEDEYRDFMRKEFDQVVVDGLKKLVHGESKELIY